MPGGARQGDAKGGAPAHQLNRPIDFAPDQIWKELPGFRFLGWICEKVPGVAYVMELGYSWWAPRRMRLAAAYTRWIKERERRAVRAITTAGFLSRSKELVARVQLPNSTPEEAYAMIAGFFGLCDGVSEWVGGWVGTCVSE